METVADVSQMQAARADGAASYSASPFAGGGLRTAVTSPGEVDTAPGGSPQPSSLLSSPFAEGYSAGDEGGAEQLALEAAYQELADESFDEAVQALIDEVAARHLTAMSSWSREAEAAALATTEVADWVSGLAAQADRILEHLEREFGDRAPESLTEEEVLLATERLRAGGEAIEGAAEQLFGGLVKKVVSTAKAVAKTGLAAVGKVLPMGLVLRLIKRLVRPLLTAVVRAGTSRLPAPLRGPATELARKLGVTSAEIGVGIPAVTAGEADPPEPAAEFDRQLAEALAVPTDSAVERIVAEAEAGQTQPLGPDPLAALDSARATLARKLAEAEPGRPPVAEVEEFIPAVMAVLPLARRLIGLAGRERVKGMVAQGLAQLIAAHVGPVAARALAPPIADIGFRMLSLEAEAPETLGSEALVSALEETIGQVASLPAESLDEPLRVEAELQQAFAEAAARHLPRQLLRPDLDAHETVGESGVWVLMPRTARPFLRYRKYSRPYMVSIAPQQARAIVLADGETLEERLLDGGVGSWPVQAEVHLYEAIPGTQLGHLAAFEGEGQAASTDEFEELTPETAALLIGEPGLGRGPGTPRGRRLQPGKRLFRMVVPGARVRRRPRRIVFRLDGSGPTPVLRVHLRLGEREAHAVVQLLARQAHAQVVAFVRRRFEERRRRALAARLTRLRPPGAGAVSADRAQALSAHIAETILATLAQQLPSVAPALATAAKDPAAGLTLTFTYRYPDRASVATGLPSQPALSIRPGFHHG